MLLQYKRKNIKHMIFEKIVAGNNLFKNPYSH